MLMIRLARTGKIKKPYFRLIVSEKTKDTHGDYLEILGQVNPHTKPREVVLKADRIKYWLGVGAKASPSVHNILINQGVVTGEKLRVWKPKQKAVETEKPTEIKTAKPATSAPAEEIKVEAKVEANKTGEEVKAETKTEEAKSAAETKTEEPKSAEGEVAG